jgi:hypothetical protein
VFETYRRAMRFHFHHLSVNQLLCNRSRQGLVAVQRSCKIARFVCLDHCSVPHVFLPKPLSPSCEIASKTRIDTSAWCPNEQELDVVRTISFADMPSLIAGITSVCFPFPKLEDAAFLFSIGQSDRNSLALFSILTTYNSVLVETYTVLK